MGTLKDVLTGSAISLGEGLVGNVVGSVFNRANAHYSDRLRRSYDSWSYNRFNSPSAQAEAMRRAGLNPLGQVRTQAVGSSSTSMPPAEVPRIGAGVNTLLEIKAANSNIKNIDADTNLKEEQARNMWLDNLLKEIDSENKQAVYQANLKMLEAQIRKGGAEAEEAEIRLQMLKEAFDSGVNTFIDESQLKQALTALHLTEEQAKSFDLETQRLFDREFKKLDLSARRKEVEEFLDTSEVRVALQNAQKGFARLAMNEAERIDALNEIQNETQKYYAQQILDQIKDGKPLRGVLLDFVVNNPAGAIGAFCQLANFAPNIKNTNHTTNVTYN